MIETPDSFKDLLLLKFLFNIFINEGSQFYIYRFFTKLTKPIINMSIKVTPQFIVKPIVPLYLAWLVFMVRIYLLPLLLGYSFTGNFAFIFEKDLTNFVNSSILKIALYLNYGI